MRTSASAAREPWCSGDTETETWLKSLFAEVVNQVKVEVATHKLDWCLTFHAHWWKHKEDPTEQVLVFHNREYCPAGAAVERECNQVAAWRDSGWLCDIAGQWGGRDTCGATCGQTHGFGKHLMVYSAKDEKLYFWDTYKNYLTGFSSLVGNDNAIGLVLAGAYSEVFTDASKWARMPDVNIVPDTQAVWFRGNQDALDLLSLGAAQGSVLQSLIQKFNAGAINLKPTPVSKCSDPGAAASCQRCTTQRAPGNPEAPCVWVGGSSPCIPRTEAVSKKVKDAISHPIACKGSD